MMDNRDFRDRSGSEMWMAFGIGALIGAAGALLFAPASGEETRKRVKEFAKDAGARAREGADKARHYVRDKSERIGHAVEEGRAAFRAGSEGRTNFEEGAETYGREPGKV